MTTLNIKEKIQRNKKKIIITAVVSWLLLSQLAVFWGLDMMAKRMLMPNISFDEPYKLKGATDDVSGDFALSANSRYLAWINAGTLYVEDLVLRQTSFVSEEPVEFFVWLADRSSLLFFSDNLIMSLNFEGEVQLFYEEEFFPNKTYTYSQLAASTLTNTMYVLGHTPEGVCGYYRIPLNKIYSWTAAEPGTCFTRMAMSNQTGALLLQGETAGRSKLIYLKDDIIEDIETGVSSADVSQVEGVSVSDVLLGADDRGFYVGRSEGSRYTALHYYAIGYTGQLAAVPEVLWQGDIPTSSVFLSFTVGVGFLVDPTLDVPGDNSPGVGASSDVMVGTTEIPYVLKMIWEAKGQSTPQAGAMKKFTLNSQKSLRYVFAPNGLTYLEITGDTYCWRLLK
jgi:hypothetical protein